MPKRTKTLTAKGRPVGRFNRRHKKGVLRKKFASQTPAMKRKMGSKMGGRTLAKRGVGASSQRTLGSKPRRRKTRTGSSR